MRRDELTMPDPPSDDRPGDRWICGRAGQDSACSRGPNAAGKCPLADACRVRRSWHGKRKSISLLSMVLIAVAALIATWNIDRTKVFKPGNLTSAHAQILATTLTSDRCASCHPQAATSPTQWFSSESSAHVGVTLSDRCLNCHHQTIDRSTALLAHNLPASSREMLRLNAVSRDPDSSWHDWMPRPAVDPDNIQCNACHREHRGADADLRAVTDQQCQTCHSDRFGSFADAHPDWDQWPYGHDRVIAFDHFTHATKHYRSTATGRTVTQFQCADCHQLTDRGELTRTTDYARACMKCHDESLQSETAGGIDLLALPMLPPASAQRVGSWPKSATGFFDGRITPLVQLLIRSEPSIARALRLIPEADFSQIPADDAAAVAAAQQVASAQRQLLHEIADKGHQAVLERVARLGVTRSSAAPLLRSLPPQLIDSANALWFPDFTENGVQQTQYQVPSSSDDDLLVDLGDSDSAGQSDDLLLDSDSLMDSDPLQLGDPTDDPLSLLPLEPPASTIAETAFDADRMLPMGGWFRDDLRLAIRYRGAGHGDTVLRSVIELASELPVNDPARNALLQTPAAVACVRCHPGAVEKRGQWKSWSLVGQPNRLTKFSHSPHLNIAQLADCSHCHKIRVQDHPTIRLTGATDQRNDFAPLNRAACAACHTSQAAGDSCITCHQYHF